MLLLKAFAFGFLSVALAMDIPDFMRGSRGGDSFIFAQDEAVIKEKEETLKNLRNVPILSQSLAKSFFSVQKYQELFGETPSDDFIAPLIAAAKKRGDFGYVFELNGLVEDLRKEDLCKRGKVSPQHLIAIEKLLDDYQNLPEQFKGDINRLYPVDPTQDLDGALLSAAKNSTLIQRWVREEMVKDKATLRRAFNDLDSREKAFSHRLGFFLDLYTGNAINRLILDARLKDDRNAVVQVYRLIRDCYAFALQDQFPLNIQMRLYSMDLDERALAYLKWRMISIVSVMKAHYPAYMTESLIKMVPLYNMAHSQILVALSPFLTDEEKGGKAEHVPALVGELEKKLVSKNFNPRTTGDKVNTFFWNKINVEVPRLIKTTPVFSIFSELTDGELQKLLQPNRLEYERPEQSFLDFSSLDDGFGIDNATFPKTTGKKKRKARRKIKSPQAQQGPVLKVNDQKQALKVDDQDNVRDEVDASAIVDEKSEQAVAMEELKPIESGETKIPSQTEYPVISNQQDISSLIEVVEKSQTAKMDDDAELEKEIAELMKEEQAMIDRYKDMKKANADHTALYTSQVKVGDVTKMGRTKPKVITSFRTDDFRLISNEANSVYLQNELNKTGQSVANSNSPVQFQWVFNPNVIIDRETFLFLCEVFNVVQGSNRLDYKNFISTFINLNPAQASKLQKRTKYPNRTVFQFSHVIETDTTIYIPPIGGVHPEHKSSRFNHIQVRKFLTHGGAHPYFFRLLE